MALDWGILHWIQNNISCPFLDAAVSYTHLTLPTIA